MGMGVVDRVFAVSTPTKGKDSAPAQDLIVESGGCPSTSRIPSWRKELAMQYLCLVYMGAGVFDGMSEAEQKALTRESLDYDDELRRRGHFLSANALQP